MADAGGSDTGTDSAGGDTAGSTSYEGLSDDESRLYEDGPVDLPVTIAKLDAVDQNLVTVEYAEGGLAELERPHTAKGPLAQTADYGYLVTGEAGAASAPKIYCYHEDSGTSETVTTESDGSFSCTIAGAEEGSEATLFGMAEDESVVSPPMFFRHRWGVTVFTVTNTSDLNTESRPIARSGIITFALANDDGTETVFSREIQSYEVDVLAPAVGGDVALLAPVGSAVRVISNDGLALAISPVEASSSVSARAVRPLNAEWNDPEPVFNFLEALPPTDGLVAPAAKVFVSSAGDEFYCKDRKTADEWSEETSDNDAVPICFHIAPDTGAVIEMGELRTTAFTTFIPYDEDRIFSVRRAKSQTQAPSVIASLSLLDGPDMLANGETVYTHTTGRITGAGASANGLLVFSSYNSEDELEYYLLDASTAGNTPELLLNVTASGLDYSEFVVPSVEAEAGSGYVIACATDSTDSSLQYLVLHRIEEGGDAFYKLTNGSLNNPCAGEFIAYPGNSLFFYNSRRVADGSLESPQISVIILDRTDTDRLVTDE